MFACVSWFVVHSAAHAASGLNYSRPVRRRTPRGGSASQLLQPFSCSAPKRLSALQISPACHLGDPLVLIEILGCDQSDIVLYQPVLALFQEWPNDGIQI